MLSKWAYVFDEFTDKIWITDNQCKLLESEITEVVTQPTEQEMQGRDGVLVGPNTFGPFDLSLKFFYNGVDEPDLYAFTEKIKKIVHSKYPRYVVHSDMPGRKYGFNVAQIEWEKINHADATFTITFHCYKGYSESLTRTDDKIYRNSTWQYENGLKVDKDISYIHKNWAFEIWNGSTDTIDPVMHHYLKIVINANAPNGLTIENETTGDIFEYHEPLKYKDELMIQSVHPILNQNKRVGKNTNYQWITLAPGYNKIHIYGKKLSKIKTQWIFNFIYR